MDPEFSYGPSVACDSREVEDNVTLSPASERTLVQSREIRCFGFERSDGLWDIEGRVVDTKAHMFGNDERTITAGEAMHDMQVRLTIDEEMTVHSAEAVTNAAPFSICGQIAPAVAKLVGLRIARGWREAVRQRLGGVEGCTHIVDLIMGPLAGTAFQTLAGARRRKTESGADSPDKKPDLLNTCYAFSSDGPIVRRRWPELYSGK